jgi:hypothetical protein
VPAAPPTSVDHTVVAVIVVAAAVDLHQMAVVAALGVVSVSAPTAVAVAAA